MSSTNERGHAVNVANLELLISACTHCNGKYKPSNPNLTVESLQKFLVSAQSIIKDVQAKKTAYDNAVIERKTVFDPVKKLSTRIINALNSCGAKPLTVTNARTVINKIQGKRAVSKKEVTKQAAKEGTEQPVFASTSQQSFDQVVNNFSQLIQIIKSEPLYKPNEEDLSVSTLETLHAFLMAKNSAVMNAETILNNARISRDKLLYSGENNIVELSKEVKSYIKSIFGASSAEFKKINSVSIRSI
jgi:hypothetical protein